MVLRLKARNTLFTWWKVKALPLFSVLFPPTFLGKINTKMIFRLCRRLIRFSRKEAGRYEMCSSGFGVCAFCGALYKFAKREYYFFFFAGLQFGFDLLNTFTQH